MPCSTRTRRAGRWSSSMSPPIVGCRQDVSQAEHKIHEDSGGSAKSRRRPIPTHQLFYGLKGNRLRINEARRKYRRWLLTRDLSTHTTRAYDGDIGRFERHVGPLTEVDDIDRDCLILFLEMQRQEGLSTASLRRRAAALRGFFRWMLPENIVPEDP